MNIHGVQIGFVNLSVASGETCNGSNNFVPKKSVDVCLRTRPCCKEWLCLQGMPLCSLEMIFKIRSVTFLIVPRQNASEPFVASSSVNHSHAYFSGSRNCFWWLGLCR